MRRIAILACFVAAVSGESSSAIDANDYRVFWQGRTRRGGYDGTSVAFDWEAVSFTVSVTGATQVTAVFNPMLNLNTKVAIIVNGDDMGRMYINNTLNTYTIAANLNPSTTNVVEVFNTMEPMHIFGPDSATAGVLQAPSLSSVVSDGTFNIPPQPFKHKLLVIGDSITAGSGAAGSPPCHGDLQTSDAFVSYGKYNPESVLVGSSAVVHLRWLVGCVTAAVLSLTVPCLLPCRTVCRFSSGPQFLRGPAWHHWLEWYRRV